DGRSAGRLIGLIEKATDHMLDKRAAIGARARRVQTTVRQLEDINLLMTGLLSSVEDADVVEVSTQLATQQNIYQAALNAVARALAPSLSDFVR
ncbi:MAG TPA: flagellin, partial [candidate division Zixibacteria bacterium]|nr:flagellin [candidate division Zixibacteria bacterium]